MFYGFMAVAALVLAIMFDCMIHASLRDRIMRLERIEQERRAMEDAELERKIKAAYEKPMFEYINGAIGRHDVSADYEKFYTELAHLYEEEAKEFE